MCGSGKGSLIHLERQSTAAFLSTVMLGVKHGLVERSVPKVS